MDKATTAELIEFILESLRLVNRRFSGITSSDDFLDTDEVICQHYMRHRIRIVRHPFRLVTTAFQSQQVTCSCY